MRFAKHNDQHLPVTRTDYNKHDKNNIHKEL